MFSNFMAISFAWLDLFISPNPSMFDMPSTVISSSSQTGDATAEKLMEGNTINGEKDEEIPLQSPQLR